MRAPRAALLGGYLTPIGALFAQGTDGFDFDFSKLPRLYQDEAATTPVSAIDDVIGYVRDAHSTSAFNNGTQSGASLKPKYQADGAKFDGTDDVLVTSYTPGSGASCLIALIKAPASTPSGQLLVGCSASGTSNFYLGITSAGLIAGGVANAGTSVVVGGGDVRGQTLVIGLSTDGTTVRLFSDTAEIYTGAQSGSMPNATAVYVGARNNAGTAANFYAAHAKRVIAARKALTLPTFLAIRSQILSGA